LDVGRWSLSSTAPDVLNGAVDCIGHILRVPAIGEERDPIGSFDFNLGHRQPSPQRGFLAEHDCIVPARELAGGARQVIGTIEERADNACRRLRQFSRAG
jgi:hypothetical protein